MATAAFQTLSQELAEGDVKHPPAHLGKCWAWYFNGDLVKRDYPVFYAFNKGNNP